MNVVGSCLLGAGAALPFLVEVVLLIVAGAAIAYPCHRIGLVPIVGFLVTGVLIGPHGLGLVKDRLLVDSMAERITAVARTASPTLRMELRLSLIHI